MAAEGSAPFQAAGRRSKVPLVALTDLLLQLYSYKFDPGTAIGKLVRVFGSDKSS